jgi:hypothetical protein
MSAKRTPAPLEIAADHRGAASQRQARVFRRKRLKTKEKRSRGEGSRAVFAAACSAALCLARAYGCLIANRGFVWDAIAYAHLTGKWLAGMLMDETDEAYALLSFLDEPERLPELSSYLAYPHFDPARFPNLQVALEREGITPRTPRMPPYRCHR